MVRVGSIAYLFAVCTALVVLALIGCGSNASSAPITPPPTVTVSPQVPTALAGGASEVLTATVANDSANAGVTWVIVSGGGSLTAATSTSVTYVAPLPVDAGAALITATSKTDPNISASITIPLLAISVNPITPTTVTLSGGGSEVFSATVANDSSNSGVIWSIGTGVGALSGASTTAVTYAAPPTVSTTTVLTVTLTATSTEDPTKSASATITLPSTSAPASKWVYYDSGGDLEYQPLDSQGDKIMDFSTAGYGQGAVPIPTAPVEATVSPAGGDDTANIQAAIASVSALPLDSTTGLRGAVLLRAGSYTVSNSLMIAASGVVLRGSGSGTSPTDNTVITMSPAVTPYPLVVLGSAASEPSYLASSTVITDAYVPSGTLTLHVANTSGLSVGTNVIVTRPVTSAWVSFMGMTASDLGTNCSSGPCDWIDPGSDELKTDRTITAINGDQITLDAPISDSIDSTYCGVDGATLQAYTFPERITQVGVENLRAIAPVPPTNLVPPTPSYQLVVTYSVLNAWVRSLTAQDTLESIDIDSYSKQVTVSNVAITHTVTQTDDAKFEEFYISGATQVLMDTVSDAANNMIFFSTSSATQGPNVLRNGSFVGKESSSHTSVGLPVCSSKTLR